jgi:uncharacterized protein with FMN-binding domain
MQNSSKVWAGVVIVLAVGFFIYWFEGKTPVESETPADNVTATIPENNTPNSSTETGNTKYADGNFSLTEDYMSPGGKDQLGVMLALKDGLVADVNVQNMAGDKTSSGYQDRFIAGIKAAVVGKSIESLKLGVVSGASLTTGAFNKALAEIRNQAQSVK